MIIKSHCKDHFHFHFPTVFDIYKFQKPLWACLGMPDHVHLKLHDQFVALTDMKLRAQN